MPLGLPVVPEVYSRNSGCSESNASECARWTLRSTVSCHHASRPSVHRDVDTGAAHHQYVLDRAASPRPVDRLVDALLQRHRVAAPVLAVGGDHHFRRASSMRARSAAAEKPREDHAVHDAQPRARQHRDDGLGDHRHVDGHPVAGGEAERGQCVGGLAHLVLELGIGDGRARRRRVRPPSGSPPDRRCRPRHAGRRSCRRR